MKIAVSPCHAPVWLEKAVFLFFRYRELGECHTRRFVASKPTSRLIEPHQPWLLPPDEAAAIVGGAQVLLDMRTAGWIAPLIERSRMTRYDIIDLGAARAKLRQLGDLKLQEMAALGGKKKK